MQNWSDSCSMRKLAVHDSLIQVWGYLRLLSRWSEKTVEESEARRWDLDVVRQKLWMRRGFDNKVDMFWWGRYANVSKLCCRREGDGALLETSLVDAS